MKQVDYKPAEQRVMVLPEKEMETKTRSGIILPAGTEENRPGLGRVVRVGRGSAEDPMLYTPGQIVMYSEYAGLDIKLNLVGQGEQVFKVMNQLDIMGTIKYTEE